RGRRDLGLGLGVGLDRRLAGAALLAGRAALFAVRARLAHGALLALLAGRALLALGARLADGALLALREERRPREAPVEADAEPEAEITAPARPAGDREAKFLEILEELSGKLQAVLLNEGLERVGDKVAVRDLADTLKKDIPGVQAVVFDGVVTQRLIDIALDKKIQTLVGVKTGNITKKPASVEVVTRADLA
ncbi:MAG TPA: hypothetical protein VFH78_15970, partial [Candidatus Thermoplasmatota archaeon]|nr:hypothetical protein [Candidatus Thermoplasmatota archaeon]